LRIGAKAWIYNKYQEGAGFLPTFLPAEKSWCHSRRHEAGKILKILRVNPKQQPDIPKAPGRK
jgi:hypothetical protein